MRNQRQRVANPADEVLRKALRPFAFILMIFMYLAFKSWMQSFKYDMVMRDNIYGVPRGLFHLSVVVALGYSLLVLWFIRVRLRRYFEMQPNHLLRAFASVVVFLSTVTAPIVFTVWGVARYANGAHDTSPPRVWKVTTTKKVLLGDKTPYYLARDWKNPAGWVYFMAHKEFAQKHPLGSTFTVTTKSGYLGYEWYVSGYSSYENFSNADSSACPPTE